MRRFLRTLVLVWAGLLLLLVGGYATLFILHNAHLVVIRLPSVSANLGQPIRLLEYETPLCLVLAGGGAGGLLLASIGFAPMLLRLALQRRRERRFIRSLEGELGDLRTLPLTDPAPLIGPEEDLDLESPPAQDVDDEALLMAALRGEDPGRGPR